MVRCTNVDIEGTCQDGKWYNRLPLTDCKPGYEHPTQPIGSGVCYCLADPEAKQKLDCANNPLTCSTEFATKYVYIIAAIIIIYILSDVLRGRR